MSIAGGEQAIASVTLWDTAGGPLGATAAHLAGASVALGSAGGASATGCLLTDGPLPGMGSPPPAGFEARAVVCGSAGDEVELSFPNMLAAGGPGRLAVKLCTVPAEGTRMAGAATLLVKTSA